MKLFVSILIITFMFSCSKNKVIIGLYEAKNFTQSIDTLNLKSNYSYDHLIYNKETGRLVSINTGNWEIKQDKIYLTNFLSNHDDIKLDKDANKLFLNEYLDIEGIFEKDIIIWKDMNFYYQKI